MTKDANHPGETVGLPAGTKIGKYVVVERRAIGGQAIVYKCHDPLLDRFVAIKQISTHLAEDPKFLERFRKEAQIIARIGSDQPAIVTIHELIEDEKGLFIVMEFLPGHSLESTLRDNPQPVEPKAALQIIWRLAAALHDVHSAGIIHRDIKPGNIIIGDGLRVKITDFGVAASTSGQTSMVLGTTKYMAPELFGGSQADGRADIYSLGMVAYEMLLGRPKFEEVFADVVRDKHSEALRWMKWHGNDQVRAPRLDEVNAAVPKALAEIVERMLAKKPAERFQSMEELGRAIKQSFSPRGRGAGIPAPAKAAPAVAAAPERVGPGDDADRLEIETVTPATAPLPTSRLSLRTKAILAGVVTVSLITIGIILGVQAYQRSQGRMTDAAKALNTAQAVYEKGERDYSAQTMKDALEQFQGVRKQFGGSDVSRKAGVFILLAKSYAATLAANEEGAKVNERLHEAQISVDDAIREINDLAKSSAGWEKWAGEVRPYVDRCRDFWTNTGDTHKAMEGVEEALSRNDLAEARRLYSLQLAGANIRDPKLQATKASLDLRLRTTELLARFQGSIDAAEQAVARGEIAEAQAQYGGAGRLLESDDAAILPDDRRKELQASVARKTKAMELRSGYQTAVAAAEAAKQGGQKPEEQAALERALASRESLAGVLNGEEMSALERGGAILAKGVLQDRIQRLKSDIKLQEAGAEMEKGDIDAAIAALEEARTLYASPEVEAALAKAKAKKEIMLTVKAAKEAEEKGKLDEAKTLWTKAASLDPENQEYAAKVANLSYDIPMQKAKDAIAAGRYKEALDWLEKAREAKPDNAPEVDALIAFVTRAIRYTDAITQGDAFLKGNKYSQAKAQFIIAKGCVEDPVKDKEWAETANKRLALTGYEDNLNRGDAAMQTADYQGAAQFFKLAKTYMDTKEVQDRIKKAEDLLNKNKG